MTWEAVVRGLKWREKNGIKRVDFQV